MQRLNSRSRIENNEIAQGEDKMASKTITLKVEDVCGVDTIVAEPPVLILPNKNYKIRFDNTMDADAEVRFYEADDKGGSMIGEFCPEVNSDDVLEVDKGKKENCKPDVPGLFSYTVKAPPYAELDPIIIIEDSFAAGGGITSGALSLVLAAAGGAAFGFAGARAFSKKKSG
jgi:hypothetical protein